MAILRIAVVLASLLLAPGARAQTVTVTPSAVSLAAQATRQFTAKVTGAGSAAVIWMVNGVPGGAPLLGLISPTGLYTAPADVPATLHVAIAAEAIAAPLANGRALVTVAPSQQHGPTLHVTTTGNDANPGTSARPWRTLRHAVANVPAGDTVLVHGGVYNELVTITRSGSAAAGYITLAAAPGEAVIIDGGGLPIPNGQYGLITLANVSFVRIAGLELRNYRSNSASRVPVGIFVVGDGNHIEILRNHVHDIVTSVTSSAGDALGIAIYGSNSGTPLSNLVVDGNELNALTLGFSESLAISGNVAGWQVTNNRIHDNNNIGIDIAGYEQVAADPAVDRARDGLIAGNSVYNISSTHNPAYGFQPGADGIYVDGGAHVVIERNLVHDTDIGIEAASEHHGRTTDAVTIRSNVVYRSLIVGLSLGGADPAQNGGSSTCIVANNTFADNDTTQSGSGEMQIYFHAAGNRFVNNIAAASAQGLLLSSVAPTPVRPAVFDHTLYDSPLGAGASQWILLNRTYTGFASYRRQTGQDAGSGFASPGFVGAAKHNYRLSPGSPALRRGRRLPLSWEGLTDFAGNPRASGTTIDLGAFEN